MRTLANACSDQWRGQAADAFRVHVHEDVLHLASKAADSVTRAARALRGWEVTLAALQEEARGLDRQAAPYREQMVAAARAAGLPPGVSPPWPATLKPAQHATLDEAGAGLAGLQARAADIHARYLAAVQQTGSQLDGAGNMAPRPPGWLSSLVHDVESGWDVFVHDLSAVVHDKALLEFISGVCNIIATVAGLLALIPPLSLVFGPIALTAAGFAMVADLLLAEFDHGSWGAVLLDAVAVAGDAGWMKAAAKLSKL